MTPLQHKWELQRTEHRFYVEMAADFFPAPLMTFASERKLDTKLIIRSLKDKQ